MLQAQGSRNLLSQLPATPSSLFPSLLKLCKKPQHLQQTHARFVLQGLHQNPALAAQLIESYSNFGLPTVSKKVFYSLTESSSLLFSAFLRNLAKLGDFEGTLFAYQEMVLGSMYPDEETYPFVIGACSRLLDVVNGRKVHGHVAKLGVEGFCLVARGLLEMYGRFGDVKESLRLYGRMGMENVEPGSRTTVTLLRCSSDLGLLNVGRAVHSVVIVSGLCEDLSLDVALLSMYSKLGSLRDARLVFEKMPRKDCIAWNILLSAYSQNECPGKSMELLRCMVNSGASADLFTAIPALASIRQLKSINLGKEMHAHVIRNGLDYQVSVHNAVIDMYCECNCLNYAQRIFDSIDNKTVVSWSSMIKGYVNHDQPLDALSLFAEMKLHGSKVDFVMVINLLPACVKIGGLEQIKYLHGFSIKFGLNLNLSVSTSLLVSYAKCGCIEMARKLFDEEKINKDLIAWTSMISAYAKHGDWSTCFKLYSQLKQSNLKPDKITFLGLLTACVNSGLVKEGRAFFKEMREIYGYQPSQEHYACMVDLLGRAGHLKEASEIIKCMPFDPNARVWGPLLSASKMHSETRLAEFAANKLLNTDPTNAGNYILLSNIYAAAGKWDGVAKMRNFLTDKGLRKIPGISWLEINGRVHEFVVADGSYSKADNINLILQILELEIKNAKHDFEITFLNGDLLHYA